jgi:hypothetical protein
MRVTYTSLSSSHLGILLKHGNHIRIHRNPSQFPLQSLRTQVNDPRCFSVHNFLFLIASSYPVLRELDDTDDHPQHLLAIGIYSARRKGRWRKEEKGTR